MGLRVENIDVCLLEAGSLDIIFHEDDSEFDGNDFEYHCSLNSERTETFLKMIPHHDEDVKANVEDWLVENGLCARLGRDLLRKWTRMGLHGNRSIWEDYPGGIYRKEEF